LDATCVNEGIIVTEDSMHIIHRVIQKEGPENKKYIAIYCLRIKVFFGLLIALLL